MKLSEKLNKLKLFKKPKVQDLLYLGQNSEILEV
jgi:hypothetical protein